MSFSQIVVTEHGPPEVLQERVIEALPEPGPGQVRVRVAAAGTGFTDTLIRKGQYPGVSEKPPFVPGYEWFGSVDALDAGVTGLAVGDAVADMSVTGGYTQVLLADAAQIVRAPEGLDPTRAVAMMLSYATAYQMLTRLVSLGENASCLVQAAGGATGTALLDCARALGVTAYGTGSPAKHDIIRSYGGIPIDYRSEDIAARIAEETGGKGVDIAFDPIGAASFDVSRKCLKEGGLLVIYGALLTATGEESTARFAAALAKHLALKKAFGDGRDAVFYHIERRRKKLPEEYAEDVQTLFGMLAQGRIAPAIASVEPLADAARVHRMIDAAEVQGKIVLDCT